MNSRTAYGSPVSYAPAQQRMGEADPSRSARRFAPRRRRQPGTRTPDAVSVSEIVGCACRRAEEVAALYWKAAARRHEIVQGVRDGSGWPASTVSPSPAAPDDLECVERVSLRRLLDLGEERAMAAPRAGSARHDRGAAESQRAPLDVRGRSPRWTCRSSSKTALQTRSTGQQEADAVGTKRLTPYANAADDASRATVSRRSRG